MPEEKPRVYAYVDSQLKEEAQVKAIRDKVSLSEAIERLLQGWVSGELTLPEKTEARGAEG